MYLVIDVEATCWKKDDRQGKENEIIEIGAVVVTPELIILDEFQSFVRATRNPELSRFCKELTGISQEDVDEAPYFPEAYMRLRNWVQVVSGLRLQDITFCSWGYYDKKQFEKDIKYHAMLYLFGRHRSIKHEFAKLHKIRPCGLGKAMKILGINRYLKPHQALNDVKCVVEVMKKILGVNYGKNDKNVK